jgi:hypothetical protein
VRTAAEVSSTTTSAEVSATTTTARVSTAAATGVSTAARLARGLRAVPGSDDRAGKFPDTGG